MPGPPTTPRPALARVHSLRRGAAEALELGFDAVLLNSAVSQARDPVAMAGAFAKLQGLKR